MKKLLANKREGAQKGFSLVEMLIVIAIIGLLSSTILASLSVARQKARDIKRIAEVGQITRALNLYFDSHQTYPSTTPTCSPACSRPSDDDVAIQLLSQLGLLPTTPIPMLGGANTYYVYRGVYNNSGVLTDCDAGAPAGTVCSGYSLGISLERDNNPVLENDADRSVGTFYGANPHSLSSTYGTELCYDLKM